MQTHRGDLTVRTAGAVIEGLDVHGFIRVHAEGVVIRSTRVRGGPATSPKALVQVEPGGSLVIEDSTLAADTLSPYVDGLRGANIVARRLDVHSVIDAVRITGDSVRVETSWLHDNAHFTNDPTWNGGPSHDDTVQIQQGRGISLVGNVMSGASSAAILIGQDTGRTADVQIRDNVIDGGACSVNVTSGAADVPGIVVADNVFGRSTRHPSCAVIAPEGVALRMSGNVYVDGAGVRLRTG